MKIRLLPTAQVYFLSLVLALIASACAPPLADVAPSATEIPPVPTEAATATVALQPTSTSPQPTAISPESTESPAPPPTATTVQSEPTENPESSHESSETFVYDIFAPGGMGSACVSNPRPQFSAHITDLSMIDYLSLAGTVQGGDLKPHGFLHNLPGLTQVPVYAPIDSYLIDFAYYTQSGYSVYTFKFQVSCEVAYYFDHLYIVVDRIGVVTPDSTSAGSHGTPVSTPLFFQAGELIGYTGDSPLSRNWDFGVLNTGQWNLLPTDEPFNESGNVGKYRYAVCPYEYFDVSMRAQYDALLGDAGKGFLKVRLQTVLHRN